MYNIIITCHYRKLPTFACWFSFVINRNLAPKIQQISYPGCHFSGSPGTVEF